MGGVGEFAGNDAPPTNKEVMEHPVVGVIKVILEAKARKDAAKLNVWEKRQIRQEEKAERHRRGVETIPGKGGKGAAGGENHPAHSPEDYDDTRKLAHNNLPKISDFNEALRGVRGMNLSRASVDSSVAESASSRRSSRMSSPDLWEGSDPGISPPLPRTKLEDTGSGRNIISNNAIRSGNLLFAHAALSSASGTSEVSSLPGDDASAARHHRWKLAFKEALREEQKEARNLASKSMTKSTNLQLRWYFIFLSFLVLVAGSMSVSFLSRRIVGDRGDRAFFRIAVEKEISTAELIELNMNATAKSMGEFFVDASRGILTVNTEAQLEDTLRQFLVHRATGEFNATQVLYTANKDGIFVAVSELPDGSLETIQVNHANLGKRGLEFSFIRLGVDPVTGEEFVIKDPPYQAFGPYDPTGRPWWTDTKKRGAPTWSPPYTFPDGRLGITYAVPIIDAAGEVIQVVAADVLLTSLAGSLATLSSDVAEIFLFDSNTRSLIATTRTDILTNEATTPDKAGSPFITGSYEWLNKTFDLSDPVELAKFRDGVTGEIVVGGSRTLVMGRSVSIDIDQPWIAVVAIPVANLERKLSDLLSIHVVIIVVGFVTFLVFAMFLVDKLSESTARIQRCFMNDEMDVETDRHLFREFNQVHDAAFALIEVRHSARRMTQDVMYERIDLNRQMGTIGLEHRKGSVVIISSLDDSNLCDTIVAALRAEATKRNGFCDVGQMTSTSLLFHFGVLSDSDTHLKDCYEFAKHALELSYEPETKCKLLVIAGSGNFLAGNVGIRFEQRYCLIGPLIDELGAIESRMYREASLNRRSVFVAPRSFPRLVKANKVDPMANFDKWGTDNTVQVYQHDHAEEEGDEDDSDPDDY